MSVTLRVGVVGGGAIGSAICRAIDDGLVDAWLVGLCELDEGRRETVLGSLKTEVPGLKLDELCEAADLVVEAVSKPFAPTVVQAALWNGADCMVLSVGGMLGRDDLVDVARETGHKIYLPTGAIAGLDAVRAAAVAGLDEVTLTTTKPPRALAGAPYITEQGIDLDAVKQVTTVFEGSVAEATAGFPANVNVAAVLALASGQPELVRVKVVADPGSSRNRHEIATRGPSGTLRFTIDNEPFPDNPKTSWLAALSAIALLRRLTSPLVIGS